ncbi:MAG: hypothetical protein RR808_01825 [Akkermansia sp.]
MTLELRPQQEDLKANVKRWLKARGLDYKWLAGQCFVSELPVTLPSVKIETESRVILQLPSAVQATLERKALDCKMTLTDFLATKINEIVHNDALSGNPLAGRDEYNEFSEDEN